MKLCPMEEKWLEQTALLETKCFSTPWSLKSLQEELLNPAAFMLVAVEDGNRLLGWAGLQTVLDEASVTNVAVDPLARRQGVGKLLTRGLITLAQQKGCSVLILEVRSSNTAALTLYNGLGFVKLGVRPGFYDKPTEDAVMMLYKF